jgi:Undecaprenyl-phosphate glucose phosphotransferase
MSGAIAQRVALGRGAWETWQLPISYSGVGRVALCIDALLIALASVATGVGYHVVALGHSGDVEAFVGVGAVVAALVVPSLSLRGFYDTRAIRDARLDLRPVLMTWCGALLFLAGVAFSLKFGSELSRDAVLAFAGAGGAALCLHRLAWHYAFKSNRISALIRPTNVIVISYGPCLDRGRAQLSSELEASGHHVLKRVDLSGNVGSTAELEAQVLGAIEAVRGSEAEAIFLAIPWQALSERFLRELRCSPLPVRLLPEAWAAELLAKPSISLGSFAAVEIKRAPLDDVEQLYKRLLDILCALLGLVVLTPLMALTAVAIRFDTPGPILFRQTRLGFNGKPFKIYKFRSMTVLEDGDHVRQASRTDARVTRVGYWIRRLSIDELPQLLNVLRGEMSIVGPRPHAVAHDTHYNKLIAAYAFRHHVKPGLTGLAQVKGYRGETPDIELMARRVEHDIRYIDTWSLWLDITIILRTAFELVRSRQAY